MVTALDAMGKPVKFRIGTAQKQVMYDEVLIASGAVTANASFPFFANLTGKNELSTNVLTQRRIPAGTIFEMMRVSLRLVTTYGNTLSLGADIKKILENCSLTFLVNSVQIAQGPALQFPTGYGIYGQTVEMGQSVLSNGLPSESAPAGMLSPVIINDQYDMKPTVTFNTRVLWDASYVMPTLTNSSYLDFELLGTQFTAATLG
jgi:hypothetical protein